MNKIVTCPDCGNKIIIPDDAQVGQIITCLDQLSPNSQEGCYSEFELVSTDPSQIVSIEEEEK